MGELEFDDKKVSKHLQIQKPQLKRSFSVLRECGEAYSDGRMLKKMKESNHETIQHLAKHEEYDNEKQCSGRQHEMRSGVRSVKKKSNDYGTAKDSPVGDKVVSSAHVSGRRSAVMLRLPSSPLSSSSLESDVVRDGPRKEANKRLPITPENYRSEAERIKSFDDWPLSDVVNPEQLAHVGFVYTGEGALVQCFQCGVKYSHWYKGDVPLIVHQVFSSDCLFLQTLTSEGKSSPAEQRPPQSYDQPGGEHSLQFPYCSDQAARTRLKPFLQYRGAQGRRHVVGQNWEGSDNDEHCRDNPNHSLMASGQICVAKPEMGYTSRVSMQSIHRSHYSGRPDNSNKCFKSPTQSLSGSLRTPRCSERFAVEGGLQEMESNNHFTNTISHITNYYSTAGAEQRIIRSDTVVAGIQGAVVLRQDSLSSSSLTSADRQSDIDDHSLDSEHISSSRTAVHSGDVIETTIPRTCCSPNLRRNQLPSSADARISSPSPSMKSRSSNNTPDDDNHQGTISETSFASGWGQKESLSSQRVSRNISNSDDQSFYSAESHGTSNNTTTFLDLPKTNVIYHCVPDVL